MTATQLEHLENPHLTLRNLLDIQRDDGVGHGEFSRLQGLRA